MNAQEVVFRLRQHFRVDDNPALGKRLGLSPQTFYQWESGDQDIGSKTLLTIAVKYDIDLNWLFFGEDCLEKERYSDKMSLIGLTQEQLVIIKWISNNPKGAENLFNEKFSAGVGVGEPIGTSSKITRQEPGPEVGVADFLTDTPPESK